LLLLLIAVFWRRRRGLWRPPVSSILATVGIMMAVGWVLWFMDRKDDQDGAIALGGGAANGIFDGDRMTLVAPPFSV
jgi:hypothetical protein